MADNPRQPKSKEDLAQESDLLKKSLNACARAVSGDETLTVNFERGRSAVEIGGNRLQDLSLIHI